MSSFMFNLGQHTIVFGSYRKKPDGRHDYHPHKEWRPGFRCIPIKFLGNLYVMRRPKPSHVLMQEQISEIALSNLLGFNDELAVERF